MAAPNTNCQDDLLLLERVFLRLGNADTDDQLENCVAKFLPPVILKLSSQHEQVRKKVMELLVHVNKRVRFRSEVQLPMDALLLNYKDPKANTFVSNFSIIYLTMGYPRMPEEKQLEFIPSLLNAMVKKPQTHQDSIMLLVMPLLGKLGNKTATLKLKENPEQAVALTKLALEVLLLPYGALPAKKDDGGEFPVPPGMTMQGYKKLTDKNTFTAEQLEKTKQSLVKFLTDDVLEDQDVLLPLIIAAADSRFSVANLANAGLGRTANSVDWSSPKVTAPLFNVFLGSQNPKLPTDQRRIPACTRIRLKLLHYLNKSTGPGIIYPHCFQVVFGSLFGENSNPRLKVLALNFVINIVNNSDLKQLKQVASVLLSGLFNLTKSEDDKAHHAQAYTCIGKLVAKAPTSVDQPYDTLEELLNKLSDSSPELKLAIREALLGMVHAYRIDPNAVLPNSSSNTTIESSPESTPGPSKTRKVEKIDEDSSAVGNNHSKSSGGVEPTVLLNALLHQHILSDEPMVRFVATKYASAIFPSNHVASKYLLLLSSGDSKDEISSEALKALYGTARQNEIEDIVQNTSSENDNQMQNSNKMETDNETNEDDHAETNNKTDLQVPHFEEMVDYVWVEIDKRKKGLNTKHSYVIGTRVLPFHPNTYKEMLRYLRMCLNRDAGIKDGLAHPSKSSPVLAEYISSNLLESVALDHYLSMITILLTANPDDMSLRCLLEIIGCVPKKMAPKYMDKLPFLKNLFITSAREDIRDNVAALYAIIMTQTADKQTIEKDLLEFIEKANSVKNFETQSGYASAFSHLLERYLTLWKKDKNKAGKGFQPAEWEPYKKAVICLSSFISHAQPILVSSGCNNIALLGKCFGLPLPNSTPAEDTTMAGEKIFAQSKPTESGDVTKFGIVAKLFGIINNPKLASRLKEKATITLGILCIGEKFPYSKQIIEGFLDLAKETKDFEIHLQVGESLVLCITGVNAEDNRDLWSELPLPEGKIRDESALVQNDILLNHLLDRLLDFVKTPHPNSRQASCTWLLALLKSCPTREPVKTRLSVMQEAFMNFLTENNDVVQDVASKGLSLVYNASSEAERQGMVNILVEQLAGGSRSVAQVTPDTKLFEEGQLGKAPTGGNLSTYKELCSLASDLNQPDLIYKFMHLANHNAVWNSKKGAAFGFQSIAQKAGTQLAPFLPKIIPRLYRYRFDPTPKIQNSMSSIWHALVPETKKTVEKYHTEILEDLVTNLTNYQWRVRISCCLGLQDLLRGAASLQESLPKLAEIWKQLFRVMDDVHEGTRIAATNTANVLSKICVRSCDVNQGKLAKEIINTPDNFIYVLLEQGVTNTVADVRQVSLRTVSELVTSAGSSLRPTLVRLIPALLSAAGDLESSRLSYLSTALGASSTSQEAVDSIRAQAAKSHYTTETMVKCVQYIELDTLESMLPSILELLRSPQLGTRVATTHFVTLVSLQLGKPLSPIAGKILSALVSGLLDRNSAVRKHCADAIGHLVGTAKDSSVDKLIAKLTGWYKERDDDSVRSAIALSLQAIANHHSELLRERSDNIMPVLFLAMHAEKTPESKSTVELFEEVWSDLSPSKQSGIKQNLPLIVAALKEAINSPSWTMKAQAANAVCAVAKEMKTGLGTHRQELIRVLLEGLKGRTFQGKEKLLTALSSLCEVNTGEEAISAEVSEEVVAAVMKEASKQEPQYRRHALTALGDLLSNLSVDYFHQLYTIVQDTLTKDLNKIGKDSSDEECSKEEANKKREHFSQLKEAVYESLGKAWPQNRETQAKYQKVFVAHCAEYLPTNTRVIQVAILSALSQFIEKLALLKAPDVEPMDTDDDTAKINNGVEPKDAEELSYIVDQVSSVLDFSLSISKNTRLRKEALNILNTMGKKLRDCKQDSEFEKLQTVFTKFQDELIKDNAPEVRSRMVHLKTLFSKV